MLLDLAGTAPSSGRSPFLLSAPTRWGANSEYGMLYDVMVCAPDHLEVIPCNTVARDAMARGLACCPDEAVRQHNGFAAALTAAGVRCHFVPPAPDLPDLVFTRDATLMTPWGLLQLSLAEPHRRAEAAHVAAAAARWGVKLMGPLGGGAIEGGDVCLVRPGLVAIGLSGERSSRSGAEALAAFFEARGWEAVITHFHPHFLHLDTLFTMVSRDQAVACVDALEPAFLDRVRGLGISLLPVTHDEVERLGANMLSLGGGRLLSSAENRRVNAALERLGFTVTALDIDQFTRCGGGMHCLTMPLSRLPG